VLPARHNAYRDREGRARWRLVSPNGRVIAASATTFPDEKTANEAFQAIRSIVADLSVNIQHSDSGLGWVWIVSDSNGHPVAAAIRGYERYATCRLAYERFVAVVPFSAPVNARDNAGT